MNLEIPCELYARLAPIPARLDPENPDRYLQSILFERRNNKLMAFATNSWFAAIEYLGPSAGPDELMAIAVDPALIAQCNREAQGNGSLFITDNPALGFVNLRTTFGFNYQGNARVAIPDGSKFHNWRSILRPPATASNGVMYWPLEEIEALGASSPSGGIVFPEHIDTQIPIVVRDQWKDNWFGVFIGRHAKNKFSGATVPEWV